MVRVNQFIALGAVLALSMLTAQTALAGPAGATGDSITVVGSVGGGPGNLWVTDPDLASANLGYLILLSLNITFYDAIICQMSQ